MANIRKDILEVLEQAKLEIQANMAQKGINASGRSSRAFHISETNDAIRLVYGSDERHAPLDTLEIGRPAGNVPGGFSSRMAKTGEYAGKPDVSNTFKAILIQWAQDKGFTLDWGGATCLGRRIAYAGTLRHQHPEDVWSTPVTKATETLRKDIRATILAEIQQITTNF